MLWYSRDSNNVLQLRRNTRLQHKINFKALRLETKKYIITPMNLGNVLWNRLTCEEQLCFSNSLVLNR